MSKMTLDELTEMHARYARKGAADPLDLCLEAVREGRLYTVDTRNDGADSLLVADDAEDAMFQVASHCFDEPEAWLEGRGWSAYLVELS